MIAGIGTDTAVVTATLVLSGVVTGWLGYRIRYRGDVRLIAGYRSGMRADTETLTRVVGRVVLAVAAVTVLAGLLYPVLSIDPADGVTYWAGYTIVVVILSGYAVLTARRYLSEP
jgi:membrane associated rhomboid family serine protease